MLAISLNFLLYVLKLLQLLFPMINIGYFLSLRFFFYLLVYQGRMADVVCDTELVLHDWEIRNIPRATTMKIKSVCVMIHTTVTHLRYRWACLQTCCQTKRTLNDMFINPSSMNISGVFQMTSFSDLTCFHIREWGRHHHSLLFHPEREG